MRNIGKVLSTTIKLAGKIDPSVGNALDKMTSKTDRATKSMSKSMKGNVASAGNSMKNTFKSIATTALTIFGAVKAAGALKDFGADCITAAEEQITEETKLKAVLGNVVSLADQGQDAVNAAADNLMNTASKIQSTGVIGDETMLAGMQQLATFQLDDSQITTLSDGMADLLAQQKGLDATSSDAVTIANMIGKAMNGSTGALSKVGVTFTDAQKNIIETGTETEKAAAIAEVLQMNVGGVNEALAATDQGKLKQASNTLGDMKEQIGMKLLPLVANFASKALPLVSAGFDKIGIVIDKLSPIVSSIMEQGFGRIKEVTPMIEKVAGAAIPFLQNQVLPILQKVFDACNWFASFIMPYIIRVVQAVLPVLQSVFSCISPIIDIMIARLAPAIQILVPILTNIIEAIMPPLKMVIDQVRGILEQLAPVMFVISTVIATVLGVALQAVVPIFQNIIGYVSGFLDILSAVISFVTGVFTTNWSDCFNNVASIFISIWDSIKQVAHDTLQSMVSPLNCLIGGVNTITSVVGIKAIPQITIPEFAEGGTLNKATLLIAGEGKDSETIVPHNNKPRSVALLNEAAKGVGRSVGSKIYQITYAPVIHALDVSGVKDELEEDFNKFKEFMSRYNDEDEREVFA